LPTHSSGAALPAAAAEESGRSKSGGRGTLRRTPPNDQKWFTSAVYVFRELRVAVLVTPRIVAR